MYENYAKLRNKLGLNDRKVAKMTGVSPSVFTRWKNGTSSPSSTTRVKICEALGIKPVMYFADIPEQSKINENNKDIPLPYDLQITVDGNKYCVNQKDYEELQRGISAYVSAWLKEKQKN